MSGSYRYWILLLLSLLLLGAVHAQAADLTVYVGGVSPGDLNLDGVRTALDGSPILGVRLGTYFVPQFGLEHTLGFSPDYLFPSNSSSVKNSKGVIFNSNLILNLSRGRVVPYATAGIGLIHQYGSDELPLGTSFAVNYGGGLKFARLFGLLGLRFDARGYTATGFVSHKLTMLEISGGLLISLGR